MPGYQQRGELMLNKIYCALLWFFGFFPGGKITFMLRRQKQRLGVWWWVMIAGTGFLATGGFTWLILHILEVC
jgi:hypothetical protein